MYGLKIDENFFIIDSLDLKSVKTKLYGYALSDEKIITNKNISKYKFSPDGNGCYIYVCVTDEKIKVCQDKNGACGVYIYKQFDRFVISNSFLLLYEFLRNQKIELSINYKFIYSYLFSKLTSFSIYQTAINEIECVENNVELDIDIKTKSLHKINLTLDDVYSIDIDSPDALLLLDEWIEKYINILRFLYFSGEIITTDLSGGYDSRMTLPLFLNSDINLDMINFNSSTKQSFTMDFNIASKISDYYGFKLNNCRHIIPETNYFQDIKDIYSLFFNFSYLVHTRITDVFGCYTKSWFRFTGYGGELIRNYPNVSYNKYIKSYISKVQKYTESQLILKNTIDFLRYNMQYIKEKYRLPNHYQQLVPGLLYRETRCKFHFGAGAFRRFAIGNITINPLLDANLRKIKIVNKDCSDNFLLPSIIYSRYVNGLCKFEFNSSNMHLKDSTVKYANIINQKYVYNKSRKHVYFAHNTQKSHGDICKINNNTPICHDFKKFIVEIYNNETFKKHFIRYFPVDLYTNFQNIFSKNDKYEYFAWACISVMKLIDDIEENNTECLFDYINNLYTKFQNNTLF